MFMSEHETPENSIKFEKFQTFDVKTQDNIFKLKISFNDKVLLFEIEKIAEFPKNMYNRILNVEELAKIDIFFLQFKTTEIMVNSFNLLIKNNNLSIIEENQSMKIQIVNPLTQNTFYIDVPMKPKDVKDEVKTIVPFITSLNTKVEKLEEDLKNKSKKIEELEKDLKDKSVELKKTINELNNIKKQSDIFSKHLKELILVNCFNRSNIIQLGEIDLILSWFDQKPFKFVKLLDSTIDNDYTNTFESKCATKTPTMIFIKASTGYRFGGFTTVQWTNGSYGKDSKAFLFSLNLKAKYNITNENNANYLSSGSYFQFGGNDIRINNNYKSNQYNYVTNNSFTTAPQNYGINGGSQYFTVSNLEVYQVEFQ